LAACPHSWPWKVLSAALVEGGRFDSRRRVLRAERARRQSRRPPGRIPCRGAGLTDTGRRRGTRFYRHGKWVSGHQAWHGSCAIGARSIQRLRAHAAAKWPDAPGRRRMASGTSTATSSRPTDGRRGRGAGPRCSNFGIRNAPLTPQRCASPQPPSVLRKARPYCGRAEQARRRRAGGTSEF